MDLSIITQIAQAADPQEYGRKAGKAIALGIGAGLGTIGPGIGVGFIFGKVIESVTRQPEMRDEITGIQWLGFALTEACFFYGLVAGLIAFWRRSSASAIRGNASFASRYMERPKTSSVQIISPTSGLTRKLPPSSSAAMMTGKSMTA